MWSQLPTLSKTQKKKKKKKIKIKTLLKKNGKLHERKKPNLTLHHLQISNPEKLAYIFS